MRRVILFFSLVAMLPASAQQASKLMEFEGKGAALTSSIIINHKDVKNIVVSVSGGRTFYTSDGGSSWKESTPKQDFGSYGESSLLANGKGELYCLHPSNPNGQGPGSDAGLDRIVCQKSADYGSTWEIVGSFGSNQSKDVLRPRALAFGKKHVGYAMWTQFDKYESKDQACASNLLFSLSSNGAKWTKPIQINQTPGDCTDGDNTVRGGSPGASLEGRLFTVWSNQGTVFFDRSYDGGETWLTNDLAIARQAGGWAIEIPGFGKTSGAASFGVDASPGRYSGTISIALADQKNGENDTDIWYIRSTNFGDNWAPALRVNKDGAGKHQFMPALTIDQTTGHIYVVYYDRRDHDDNQTDLYLAVSVDGGSAFTESKISDTPFVASEEGALCDNIGISAYGGIIAVAWTRKDGDKTSVWATLVKEEQVVKGK